MACGSAAPAVAHALPQNGPQRCGSIILLGHSAQLAKSPRPDRSAEILSLRGTDNLVADDDRYDRIAADLTAIRGTGRRLIAQTAFEHFATQTLLLKMNSDVRDAIRNGTYGELDCLNDWYGVHSQMPLESVGAVSIHFSRLYHPRLIEAAYSNHADVHRAEASQSIGDGDDIRLTSRYFGGTHRYVFRSGLGDCPAGCVKVYSQAFDVTPQGEVTPLGLRGGPTPPSREECTVWHTQDCPTLP